MKFNRLSKCLIGFSCVLLAFVISSCSTENTPKYWDLVITDLEGNQYYDYFVDNCDEQTIDLIIHSNIDWYIPEYGHSGVKATPSSGKAGETRVSLSLTKNESYKYRTIELLIMSMGKDEDESSFGCIRFNIEQKGSPTIMANPSMIRMPAGGGSSEVTIKCNVGHLKVESPDWIKTEWIDSPTWDEKEGLKIGKMRINFEKSLKEFRSGEVMISSPECNFSWSINVYQSRDY